MSERRPRSALYELTRARVIEFLREPEAVFWVFAFPVLMALALGVAFRSERTEESLVGVLQGPAAADTTRALSARPGLRVRELGPEEADKALRNGTVSLLVIPGQPPVYRFDPTRPESRLARLVADAALQAAAGRADPLQPREETVKTPGSRYIDWLLPGLLGMNIMGTGMWSVGFSVVVARSRKLLKRLMATPMARGSYLASHLLGRLTFLVLEVSTLLVFGWLVFGVRTAGSLLVVAGLCLLGALCFSGIGLLVAARPRTIEGVSGLMNVVMLPMWLLSGVFFSSAHFPAAAQPFIRALPLTALNEALRAVMLEGQGLLGIISQVAVLVAWGGVAFVVALKIFRWR
jgi:ABC-2 type transport system permease protein